MALINPAKPSRPSRLRQNAGAGGGGGGGGLIAPAAGGGGGGGGSNPHLNSMRQQQRQQRRQQRRPNRGGGGATTPAPAEDDGEGVTTTGPGSPNFNSVEFAIPALQGLVNQSGINPGAAGMTGQNAWLQDQMSALYNEYAGARTADPALENQTWSNYLAGKFGGTPEQAAFPGPGGAAPAAPAAGGDILDTPVHAMGGKGKNRRDQRRKNKPKDPAAPPEPAPGPTGPGAAGDPAQMATYFKNLWYRGNPEERGYFGANITGPGRVIPG